ncbi:MAG: hypothetical protein LQ340_000866 [Diploschistes diacapsis]|nr:MAG: hypothetical protein LQ340_000866 [Diploschistes diacapsis]
MSGGEQHPLDMPPGTSFMTSPKREGRSAQLSGRQQHFNASRESQGSRHHFPGPPLSRYNNRDQVSPTERAQGTEAPTAKTPPQLSGQFKTYEEWHADKVRQELKLKEESYAMLMEENERALHVDLPCDGESVSSHSISTEPRSERSGHLPQYPLLEPIKKAPSPAALSFGIPPMTAAKAPGMPSSTPALEPIKVPFVNKLGIQQLSPINYDSDPRETGELVPGLAAHSKFQAPDWRARGKTESRACLSDTGSEKSTPRKTSKVEISPDMTENIDDITAGWDRALLG